MPNIYLYILIFLIIVFLFLVFNQKINQTRKGRNWLKFFGILILGFSIFIILNFKNKMIFKNFKEYKKEENLEGNNFTYYKVERVIDGDTININKDGNIETIRLIGINTPETVDPRRPIQCFGKEASNEAHQILDNNFIRIENDFSQAKYDKYGRELVYLWTKDGIFFNQFMIQNGFAYEYTYNYPYKYQTDFKNLEKEARDSGLGLWNNSTCNGKL